MGQRGIVYEMSPNGEQPFEDDVEAAFEAWRGGFDDAESPGYIRAFRIPLDEKGSASHSATGQVRLGMWPVDAYDFDTLLDKLKREYMPPGDALMAVRLIGTLTGKSGVRFNKIVMIQRANEVNPPGTAPKDGLADVMRAMQESNERMARIFQDMRGPATEAGGTTQMQSMMQFAAMMKVMTEPMMTMIGPLMAAVAGRPQPVAGTTGSLKETMEAMLLMDKFASRRGGGGTVEPDWVKIVASVGGVAKPLLEMAAARQLEGTRTRRALPRPNGAPAAPGSTQPTPVASAPAQPAAPMQPAPATTPAGVDLSRPSSAPTGSLSQGSNLETPSSQLPGDGNMFAETKRQIDALVEVAQQGADPTEVANAFFEQTMMALTDEAYGQLAAAIESESFLSMLGIYNTHAKDYADFFAAFRARITQLIQEADEPE